jgi:glycosyltransferase involved in cell wall biosynthesis
MKNILFVNNNLGQGGAQRRIITLARLFKQKGYKVEVVCYHDNDFFADLLEKEGIFVHWLITRNYLMRIIKFRQFIRKGNYDVVISLLSVSNFLNCLAAIGEKNWKVIIGESSAKEELFLNLKYKIYYYFYRYADTMVCNSNNAKRMWEQHRPQYKDKLLTIYNPVILHETENNYVVKRDGKLHLVIAASYQYLKNIVDVIRALSLLSNEQRAKIKIDWYGRKEVQIGDTRAADEAMSLIRENHLEEVITLNDEIKDIANRMKEADIIGLFSRVEGLPNTILEGMMIGKPVIMTRISDYDVLIDKTNGWLCDWDKPESIKVALLSAINTSDEKLLEMGVSSKRKAEELFENEKIINQWINLINS